jgi:hypothetical protein
LSAKLASRSSTSDGSIPAKARTCSAAPIPQPPGEVGVAMEERPLALVQPVVAPVDQRLLRLR